MRFLFIPIVLALSACSSARDLEPDAAAPPDSPEAVPYTALTCDASRASEVAFAFQETEWFNGGYAPHGERLLVVDGGCRYHVFTRFEAPGGVLRSGALTPEELAQMNAELFTAPWASFDGQEVSFYEGGVADAPFLVLRRDGLETRCNAQCPTESVQQTLVQAASRWVTQLWARGEPVDGPVDVVGETRASEPGEAPVEWTGAPLAPRVVNVLPGTRIEGDEALALRAIRDEHAGPSSFGPPLHVVESGVVVGIGVADVLPIELELRRERGGVPWSW